MGWLFRSGYSRKDLIEDRSKSWECTQQNGTLVKTNCLAHCYRGGVFSGVLWTVWERTFLKEGKPVEKPQRWIGCDLLQSRKDEGWGYKDMDESVHPFYYSCPLGYLAKAPLEEYGGNAEWRDMVRSYHARQAEKRQQRRLVVR